MLLILGLNACLIIGACLLPSGFLAVHSYVLYGAQLVSLVPYLLRRGGYGAHFFLPTTFALCYCLVSETLGSVLVPRFYGFQKEYAEVALTIVNYHVIVPYLLAANVTLFILSALASRRVGTLVDQFASTFEGVRCRVVAGWSIIVDPFLYLLFVGVGVVGGVLAFSLQLGILVVHAWELLKRPWWYRTVFYVAYLAGILATSFQNKRQIVIVLFLFALVEAARSGYRLRWTLPALVQYAGFGGLFLGLVLVASVLRGYGGFEGGSLLAAVETVPKYVSSDLFVDGLTDNLELNYSYGAGIASIDLTRRGVIEHQFGSSLWKVLFLPIPRDAVSWKPESALQVYTRLFDHDMWSVGGSLPVMLQSDMFMNFDVFGLLPFALIWVMVNGLFLGCLKSKPHTLWAYATLFLSITVLLLARGSGIELYFLTFLLSLPFLVAVNLLRTVVVRLRSGAPAPG